jgi:hypothetical protein
VKLLQPVVNEVYWSLGLEPPVLERNLMQAHKGGCDLVGLDWLALEVKYQEQEQVASWWEQCKRQAEPDREPVLFYRKNHAKWKVRMFGYLVAGGRRVRCPVDISVEAFLAYLRIRLELELNKKL